MILVVERDIEAGKRELCGHSRAPALLADNVSLRWRTHV